RTGEEVPADPAPVAREGVDRLEACGHRLPRVAGPRKEAAVETACHDDAVPERSSELRRECEAVLLIQRMLVLTQQHGPLRTTLAHFSPPVNPQPGTPRPQVRATRSRLERLNRVADADAPGLGDGRV